MLSGACVKRSSNSNLETSRSNRVARRNAKCELNNPQELNNPESRVNGWDSRRESNASSLKLHVMPRLQSEFGNHSRNHQRESNGLRNNEHQDRRWLLNRSHRRG